MQVKHVQVTGNLAVSSMTEYIILYVGLVLGHVE